MEWLGDDVGSVAASLDRLGAGVGSVQGGGGRISVDGPQGRQDWSGDVGQIGSDGSEVKTDWE